MPGKLVFTTSPGFSPFPVSVSVSRSGYILPENMKNSEKLKKTENKREYTRNNANIARFRPFLTSAKGYPLC